MTTSSRLSPDLWRARWRTYWSWTGQIRRLTLEAFVLLGWYRALIVWLPFRHVAPRMGWFMAETLHGGPPAAAEDVPARIGWAVRRMADHTPWRSPCLAQAMAAQRMLRRRGFGSTLYLGLARGLPVEGQEEAEAHAWLRCGDAILTGEEEMADFHPVAYYAMDTGILHRPPRGVFSILTKVGL